MSYILDALNKSEAARRKAANEGADAIFVEDEPGRASSAKWAAVVLAIALVIVLASATSYFIGERKAVQSVANATQEAPVASLNQKSAASHDKPPRTVPSEAPAASFNKEPAASFNKESAASLNKESNETKTYRFADLPQHIQAKIPALQISSHIFSSDPSLRLVNIDGAPRQEGDDLGKGITLKEITASGLVLQTEGYSFAIDMLQGWGVENP